MVQTKSSELSSLLNGTASSEEKLATVIRNGSYTDPMGRRKSKRFKESESPSPDSGSMLIRSRTEQKDVPIETCKNRNVSVLSSDAEVELIPVKIVGEGDHLKDVDVKLSTEIKVGVNKQTQSDRVSTDEPVNIKNLPDDTSEQNVVVRSACKQSIIGTKSLRGRSVPIVRDLPPYMRRNVSKSEDTVEVPISLVEEIVVVEKSNSAEHLDLSLSKSISPEPLRLEKSEATVPEPFEAKEMNGEYNEGSSRSEESLPQTPWLSDAELPPSHPTGSRLRKRSGSEASKIRKSEGKSRKPGTPIIGTVPGVEVGDKFQTRMDLNSLRIHRPSQAGIDYIKEDNDTLIAISIVATEGYDNVFDNAEVLTYTGQGGFVKKGNKDSEPKDQELIKGNLALANSKTRKNPVRVIKGYKKPSDGKKYVYDGLYLVEDYWNETGSHGKLVFKFKLQRIPGQPELSVQVVEKSKKSKKSKFRDGLCSADISEGKERLPIYAVNTIDDEKPPQFIYTVNMIYPDWCRPIPPKSCGCTKRCSESANCSCIAKNDGEIPYNEDGNILIAKTLVYECGPLCGCPPSCYLRVTQRGIKLQLEIFKTESRGWGVRSPNSIPSGSFICEYVGELLEEKEAERLAGKDEYLFDIGKEHETSGFTIDAAQKGNIGRFINHSCSPNLYAQDVLYDHEEWRIPHVMFFATDDIPPFEELSYDYNYVIDHVRDADGNIRKKECHCGSSECTGRLY